MKPVYKIEVWQGGSLLHTIENEAINIQIKKALNSIGSFSFAVPTEQGGDYKYNDINLFDTVKIWLGYDSISGDPEIVGKIYRITAPLLSNTGYIRVISGKDNGEVLSRRFKRNKRWILTDASTIVTELANDLGLGTTEIETDTNDLNLTVDTEPYIDVLEKVSDFWLDATTQIKKDFYVDVNDNLVWKSRPIRTAGVETFTVGDNIISYSVLRDLETVKNKIYVYGAKEAALPTNKDAWTESLTNWSTDAGSLSLESGGQVGSYYIRCSTVDPSSTDPVYLRCTYSLTEEEQLRLKDADIISFWIRVSPTGWDFARLRLYAPNVDHDYMIDLSPGTSWTETELNLHGRDWYAQGYPSWQTISAVHFSVQWPSGGTGTWYVDIDGLFFEKIRYFGEAEDSTSQNNYGIREAKFVDDQLTNDDYCAQRAETLLYQLKDPRIRLDLVVPGNTNLKIGDRLTINIPAENITDASFDVIRVEHSFTESGFITKATLIDTADTRQAPPATINEALLRKFLVQKEIGKGRIVIK